MSWHLLQNNLEQQRSAHEAWEQQVSEQLNTAESSEAALHEQLLALAKPLEHAEKMRQLQEEQQELLCKLDAQVGAQVARMDSQQEAWKVHHPTAESPAACTAISPRRSIRFCSSFSASAAACCCATSILACRTRSCAGV